MSLNSNMDVEGIDFDLAVEQLRSHQLSELFTQTLGWRLPQGIADTRQLNQRCLPVAERDGVVVWQVPLTAKTQFTPNLRYQIYTALQIDSQPCPLVIFLMPGGQRSLWCQSACESALYAAEAPIALWLYRLRRFSQGPRGLFPTVAIDSNDQAAANLIKGLCEGTSGIDSTAARHAYSVLTLQRLILIQQIQQKGWLAGDTWYLQMRFGETLQTGKNLFFSSCLQPLYRSFSLPRLERPVALQEKIGDVPFLGQLFHTHWVEEKYESIEIADEAFEAVLGWLSEQTSANTLDPWMSGASGYWLARYWQHQKSRDRKAVCSPDIARRICDRTLDQWLLNRLDIFARSSAYSQKNKKHRVDITREQILPDSVQRGQAQTLNDFLFTADLQVCRRLIQEILPDLRILDPNCGSGQLLVAFHQRLTDIFSILTGYIQQTQDAQLKIWRSALSKPDEVTNYKKSSDSSAAVILKNLQERVLKKNLYGVAESAEVAVSAHFQLLLHLVATARSAELIEPLIDLEFNVTAGNALVGFVTVDEERFDQVNKAGADSVLQGNLLQPLAADSYQVILSEKDIALEHYQSRSQLLAESHSVPSYARAALLREEILTLDSRAQHKLDNLLLSHMSQQLGMRYRETQMTDRPRRRPLRLSDVEHLSPFHWGYYFSSVVKKGGFDVVACMPRWGLFKPTGAEFLRQFEDLAEREGVSEKNFKTSKSAVTKGNATVAAAWFGYQDQYACIADYFSRSELYVYQDVVGRGLFVWERLFVERCFNLLASGGIGAAVVTPELLTDEQAQVLLELLDKQAQGVEVVSDEAGIAVVVWRKE